MMSISKVQMVNDQRLTALVEFICCRIDEVGSGTEVSGIIVNASKPERESEERDYWDDGYLAALKDVVVFIQCLHYSAAA